MSIAANLSAVEARVAAACSRARRARAEVRLVAVSKTFPASAVDEAVAAGITDIGENRVQELREKAVLLHTAPRKHLIGHLQSNKSGEAVRLFDVVQTVDRIELAERLARAAERAGKTLEILIQVNVGGEEQKSGCAPAVVPALAEAVAALPALELRGLMTIPPISTPEESRRWFAAMRELQERLVAIHPQAVELSMGMSEDFEVAIEEGATIVRIGRAIFGARS